MRQAGLSLAPRPEAVKLLRPRANDERPIGCDLLPKISYPGEEQAFIATKSIKMIDSIVFNKVENTCFG